VDERFLGDHRFCAEHFAHTTEHDAQVNFRAWPRSAARMSPQLEEACGGRPRGDRGVDRVGAFAKECSSNVLWVSMRIVRVALVFFSIGFLASMVEEAAGRGYPEGAKSAHDQGALRGPSVVSGGEEASGGSHEALPSHNEPRKHPEASLKAATEAIELPNSLAALRGLRPPKRQLSELDVGHISRIPLPVWMSTGSDPLAAIPDLEVSEEPAPLLQEFIMPFENGRVTSLFNQGRVHPAIDLAGPLGTPVHATSGRQRVTFAGWRGGYGNAVMAQDAQGRVHLYGHLSKITTKVGTMLERGQKLGLLGSTGHSTGPHVHYEVRTPGGGHINPVTLLFPGRKVARGFAWSDSRSVSRVAARADQPRPR
ncbi:MAG TPA: M23 family metallopeptidase, partial [Hyphomicrobiaceae bacterium]|nr:M23 family metallopeptidase [Hyphomicrobiaceae bacterium]